MLLLLCCCCGGAVGSIVKNLEYSIEHKSHTLITTWQILNPSEDIVTCQTIDVEVYEVGLTGRLKKLVRGNTEPSCFVSGAEIVMRLDLTRYKIQPFRPYKLCMFIGRVSYSSAQCSPLFSLETFIPYKSSSHVEVTSTTTLSAPVTQANSLMPSSGENRNLTASGGENVNPVSSIDEFSNQATSSDVNAENKVQKPTRDENFSDDIKKESKDSLVGEEYDITPVFKPSITSSLEDTKSEKVGKKDTKPSKEITEQDKKEAQVTKSIDFKKSARTSSKKDQEFRKETLRKRIEPSIKSARTQPDYMDDMEMINDGDDHSPGLQLKMSSSSAMSSSSFSLSPSLIHILLATVTYSTFSA